MTDRQTHETTARLLEAAKTLKGAQGTSDVARLLGHSSPQRVNNWVTRGVSKEGLLEAQRCIGVNATWLQTGEGEMIDSAGEHVSAASDLTITEKTRRVIADLLPSEKGNVVVWEDEADLPDDPGRVWIDRFDYHFSAGSGLIQWEVREKHSLPFTKSFFKAKGARPKDCKLLMLRGDSMEPWADDKNMIMVDTSSTRIMDGEKYAIYFEDEPLVKQIFKEAGGGIVLHSYNPKYPDRVVTPDKLEFVHIVGRVIYRSG
jgi:phage repressor protein C with HTH and peptisase S24 domain